MILLQTGDWKTEFLERELWRWKIPLIFVFTFVGETACLRFLDDDDEDNDDDDETDEVDVDN